MILSCTKKVLDRLKKYKKVEATKEEVGFYNWYVDEIKIERKSYFLFTHSETLFSFFVYAGTKKELVGIEKIFTSKLKEMLIREVGTSDKYQERIFPKEGAFRFMKTNSRKVLGSMNEIKFQIAVHLRSGEKLLDCTDMIHHRINKVLMRKDGDYIVPQKEMLSALKSQSK